MSPKAPRPVLADRAAASIDTGQEHCLDATANQKLQYPAHLRQQRAVEPICKIPRVVAELLTEIGRRLERYAGLDHDLLAAVGADRFAPAPLRAVGGVG